LTVTVTHAVTRASDETPHSRKANQAEDVTYQQQNKGKANRRISNVEGWNRFALSFFIVDRIHSCDIRFFDKFREAEVSV